MTGLPRDRILVPAMWSLVHELRISIIFPVLVLLFRAGTAKAFGGALVFSCICAYALVRIGEDSAVGTMLATGEMIIYFVVGIALAMHSDARAAWFRTRSRQATSFLWLLCMALLIAPGSFLPWVQLSWGVGAALLVCLGLSGSRIAGVSSGPICQWLGRVSYSLYLFHGIVLIAAVHVLYGRLPLTAIWLSGALVSLILAQTTYRLIELPAIKLGHLAQGRGVAVRPAGVRKST